MLTAKIIEDNWVILIFHADGEIEKIDKSVCPFGHILIVKNKEIKSQVDLSDVPFSFKKVLKANLVFDPSTSTTYKNRWTRPYEFTGYIESEGVHTFILFD